MTPVDRTRLPAVGADPAFTFPAVVRHRLANGLDVRTVEHRGVPLVTFALLVRGGLGADPPGREGLAAIVADMADEGTGDLTAIDVSDALARIGGDYDVDIVGDATLFDLTTLLRFGARGARLLADMVTRPSLRREDFERVRQLRIDRLRQLKDMPSAVAERAMLRLLYGPHPYGHLAIGSAEALGHLSLDDVGAFHAATTRPETATLIVCGADEHASLLRLAEEAFGGWMPAPGSASPRPAAGDVDPDGVPLTRLAVVPREGAAQSELRIGLLAARRSTPDFPALLVLNALVGGQFVSRVNLKLREEKGYTYGARTGFDWRLGLSPFVLQSSVHTAATADAIACSLEELRGVGGSRPPTADELDTATASLTRGYPRGFETAQQVSQAVAKQALFDLPDRYFADFVPLVNAVTGEDVVRAAVRYLDPARLTTLVVGDHEAIADTLRGLALGEPQVLLNEI